MSETQDVTCKDIFMQSLKELDKTELMYEYINTWKDNIPAVWVVCLKHFTIEERFVLA